MSWMVDEWMEGQRVPPMTATRQVAGSIAGSGSASNWVSIADLTPYALSVAVPSGWGTANIGIEVTNDESTIYKLRDSAGAVVQITNVQTAEAADYAFEPIDVLRIAGWEKVRVTSLNTSTGAYQAQGTAGVPLVLTFVA